MVTAYVGVTVVVPALVRVSHSESDEMRMFVLLIAVNMRCNEVIQCRVNDSMQKANYGCIFQNAHDID